MDSKDKARKIYQAIKQNSDSSNHISYEGITAIKRRPPVELLKAHYLSIRKKIVASQITLKKCQACTNFEQCATERQCLSDIRTDADNLM